MTVRPKLALGVLAVLALGLAGCSGAAPSPDASSDWSDSPLNRYLAAVWNTDVDEDEAAARNAEVEELVASCMTAEGFEYVPQDTSTFVGSGDDWKPDDREWVAQYGYGAIDWPGREAQETMEPSDDANSAYVEGLSESEAAAYYEVLYGPQPTEEELAANDGTWTSTWEQQGCYGQASHEVYGDDPTQASEHKPVMDAINDFYQAIYEDPGPEMAELDGAWADCMAEAGHAGFERQQDASQSIYDEQNAFYEEQTEVDDAPELDALQEKEVALALDDLDCREQTDYRRASLAIQFAAEEQFIADHRAELDALVADAEQARADR